MDRFRLLLSSMFLLIIIAKANHANLEPLVYWRTILPQIPMPSAIEKLLQPDKYDVGHGGFGVNKGNSKAGGVNSLYYYDAAASDTQLHDEATISLLFLLKNLRHGKNFTLNLSDNTAATTATFIPRSAAESIPFSAADLPSILSRFNIPVGSAEAAATEKALSDCERAPAACETKLCTTSLESMVDFATTSLGTAQVVTVSTEAGSTAGERVAYKVESVRKVAAAGGKGAVSCHPMEYAYSVFLCHWTATTEVYEVEMAEAESGGKAVKVAAVCHTDTAGWNPKHVAMTVLKVKPGTPVCHFLPQDQVVWVEKV